MGLPSANPELCVSAHSNQKLLYADMVDELAAATPNATYAIYPASAEDYEKGFKTLSYKQFSNIANGLAWWLTVQLGKGQTLETITYTGPNDIRQNAMILASSKAGYKVSD
jgi:acyl-coenzyme A synthetase/AMP-(fatty) acid ligase